MYFLLYAWTLFSAVTTTVTAAEQTPHMTMKSADGVSERKVVEAPRQDPPIAATQAAVAGASYHPTVESRDRVLNLDEEQKKKVMEIYKRQQMTDAQKKHEKQMLDRTPVLNKTYNPNLTEDQSIPKRF